MKIIEKELYKPDVRLYYIYRDDKGDKMDKYMHKETGSVDTREGWIASYGAEELEARGLTAEAAFDKDVSFCNRLKDEIRKQEEIVIEPTA